MAKSSRHTPRTYALTVNAAHLHKALGFVEPVCGRVGGDDVQIDGSDGFLLPRQPHAPAQQRASYSLRRARQRLGQGEKLDSTRCRSRKGGGWRLAVWDGIRCSRTARTWTSHTQGASS